MSFNEKCLTTNIYLSWFNAVGTNERIGMLRELNSFTAEELNYLKWLIAERLRVLELADNEQEEPEDVGRLKHELIEESKKEKPKRLRGDGRE